MYHNKLIMLHNNAWNYETNGLPYARFARSPIILSYVQFLFLKPVKKAERNFEIAAGTLCLRVRRYASLDKQR